MMYDKKFNMTFTILVFRALQKTLMSNMLAGRKMFLFDSKAYSNKPQVSNVR